MFFRNDWNKLMCAMVSRSTQRVDSLSEGASLLVEAVFLNSWHNKIIVNTSMYKIIPMLLWNGFHPIVSRPNLKATAPSSISSIKILMERSSRKRKKKMDSTGSVLSTVRKTLPYHVHCIALHYCTLSVNPNSMYLCTSDLGKGWARFWNKNVVSLIQPECSWEIWIVHFHCKLFSFFLITNNWTWISRHSKNNTWFR